MTLYEFRYPRTIGGTACVAVLGALMCPLMSKAAEAADIDKVPVSAMVATVASGASHTISGFQVFPLAVLDGEVVGHYTDPCHAPVHAYVPTR